MPVTRRALRRVIHAIVVGSALACASAPAGAANPEALKKFDEGKKLRAEGNCQAAVDPFLESIKAEPTIGAHYNLGYCYEQLKQTDAAIDHYRKALKLAQEKKDPREEEIRESFLRLRDVVHWVRLDVPPKVQKAPGLKITVDGEVVAPSDYAAELILRKAARHDVVVASAGHKDWVATNQPDHNTIMVDLGEAVSDAKALLPPLPSKDPARPSGSGQRLAGVVLMGVGGVGLLTGGALGIYFLAADGGKEDKANTDFKACLGDPAEQRKAMGGTVPATGPDEKTVNAYCNANVASVTDWIDWRQSTGIAAGISAGVGALVFGGGLLLYLTAGSSTKESSTALGHLRVLPDWSPTRSGLTVVGAF